MCKSKSTMYAIINLFTMLALSFSTSVKIGNLSILPVFILFVNIKCWCAEYSHDSSRNRKLFSILFLFSFFFLKIKQKTQKIRFVVLFFWGWQVTQLIRYYICNLRVFFSLTKTTRLKRVLKKKQQQQQNVYIALRQSNRCSLLYLRCCCVPCLHLTFYLVLLSSSSFLPWSSGYSQRFQRLLSARFSLVIRNPWEWVYVCVLVPQKDALYG